MAWEGTLPERCEICRMKMTDQPELKRVNGVSHAVFVDGRLKRGGWALMCFVCHTHWGTGLGLGNGQMYDVTTGEGLR